MINRRLAATLLGTALAAVGVSGGTAQAQTRQVTVKPIAFAEGRCPVNGGNGFESGPWTTPGATLQFGSFWMDQYKIGPTAPVPLRRLCNEAGVQLDRLTAGRPYDHHIDPIADLRIQTFARGAAVVSTFHCVWFKKQSGICRLYSTQTGKRKAVLVPAQTAGWEAFVWYPWLR